MKAPWDSDSSTLYFFGSAIVAGLLIFGVILGIVQAIAGLLM